MATTKVETLAYVSKVVRNDGKPTAQITISVPTAVSADIPLGGVMLTMTPSQDAIDFGRPKPVRGDHG